MKFGIFVEWPNPQLRDWRTVFDEGVEQIIYAEELGYDYAFIAEHHFSNYGMTPSPLVEIAHILARTKKIKIVTTCLVLPEWPPLRLAEEVAVIDQLAQGRFICGVGRGYQPYEFLRSGTNFEELAQRFEETLDVLKLAWTSDKSFTYDGEIVKVPHPTVIWPKPYQKPYPPIWMTTSNEAQIAYCAREGIVPLTSARTGPASVEPATTAWVQGRVAAGLPVENIELGFQSQTACAENEDEARDMLKYFQWQARGAKSLNRQEVTDGQVAQVPYEGEPTEQQAWERLYCGTPSSLIEKYTIAAEHGATIISTWLMAGGIPQSKIMNSLRLIGKHVIPALRDVRPDPAWLRSLAKPAPAPVRASGKLGADAE